MGHKDLRMTVRYSHLAPYNLRKTTEALDKKEISYDLATLEENEKGLLAVTINFYGVPSGIRARVPP